MGVWGGRGGGWLLVGGVLLDVCFLRPRLRAWSVGVGAGRSVVGRQESCQGEGADPRMRILWQHRAGAP